ncbi:MAG: hypothetical protein ACRD2C_07745 [Acidimicrobiales bacterium]
MSTGSGLLGRLGDRAEQRAQPRFGIALAGVGVLMVIVGIVAWAGERLGRTTDEGEADPDRTVGILLTLIVIAAGYALVLRFRQGPLATAGVAASALAVPVLLAFATFDATPDDSPDAFASLPFAIDAIVLLSVATWLITYTAVPIARGRSFYLAASTFLLWLYLLEKVEEDAAAYILTLPFGSFFFPLFSTFGDEVIEPPDAGTIGGMSLVVGLGYYAAAVLLDRSDYRGVATPFSVAGFVATGLGIAHLGGDLEAAGTGVLLVIVSAAMAIYGATEGRRFTTWAWTGGVGLGVLLIAGDIFEETLAGFGVAAIVLGVGVILLAHVLTRRLGEPDEMTSGPSSFRPQRPGPPAAAWAGYPAAGAPAGGAPQWPGQPLPTGPNPPAPSPAPQTDPPWPGPQAPPPGSGPTYPSTPPTGP